MGCEGLLSKHWNLRSEDTLREFKFERGNQWLKTMRHDPHHWTPDVWARVYGFPRGRKKDRLAAGMGCVQENSGRTRTRSTASTLETVGTLESGGF